MNYANPDPATLLGDRGWRVRHSLWLAAPILGMGFLSFVGFLYVAIRVKSKKFWTAAVIGALGSTVTALTLELSSSVVEPADNAAGTTETTELTDLGGVIVFLTWAALVGYAVYLNRDYLRWRASKSKQVAWYDRTRTDAPQSPIEPDAAARDRASGGGMLGIHRDDYFAGSTQPAGTPAAPPSTPAPAPQPRVTRPPGADADGPVEINIVSEDALVSSLMIDPALARRVIAARERRNGFATLDDMVAAAGLQPHELLKFRGRVSFGASSDLKSPTASPKDRSGGRIIDI